MIKEGTNKTKYEPARHDAAARMMEKITAMTKTDTSGLHPSYLRLIESAASMRGIYGENAIAEALQSSDKQKVNNWQRRGVSKDGALDAERRLGIPAVYILDDIIPPCEEWQRLRAASKVEAPQIIYQSNELRELNEFAATMDKDSLRALLLLMKKL